MNIDRIYNQLVEHLRELTYQYKCDRINQDEAPGLGNYQSDATSYAIEDLIKDFAEMEPDMMQAVEAEVDAYGCSKVMPKLLKMLDKKDSGYESWREQNAT